MHNMHKGWQPLNSTNTNNPQILAKWEINSYRLVPVERDHRQQTLCFFLARRPVLISTGVLL